MPNNKIVNVVKSSFLLNCGFNYEWIPKRSGRMVQESYPAFI